MDHTKLFYREFVRWRTGVTMKQIRTQYYRLTWRETPHHWVLDLVFDHPYHHTANFPQTYQILADQLPMILSCECFNEDNLPFKEELKATETGHLLEHILLEYLCSDKLAQGHTQATFEGTTSWNWVKEQRGTFHILIKKDRATMVDFGRALQHSLLLMEKIFASNEGTWSQAAAAPLSLEHITSRLEA